MDRQRVEEIAILPQLAQPSENVERRERNWPDESDWPCITHYSDLRSSAFIRGLQLLRFLEVVNAAQSDRIRNEIIDVPLISNRREETRHHVANEARL